MCNLGGRTNRRNGWQRGARRTSPNTAHGNASDQLPHGAANQYNNSAANWIDDTGRGSRIKFNHHDHTGNQHSTDGRSEYSGRTGDNARQSALRSCPWDGFNSRQHFAEQPEFALILKPGKRSRKYAGDIAIGSALPVNGWQRHISEVEI